MYENRRRAPPLPGLPPGAQQPAIPSPTSPHAFDIHHDLPISRQIQPRPLPIPPRPNAERPRGYSMHEQSRPKSTGDKYGDFSIGIGQANVHRSFSHLQTGRPTNDGWSPLTARPLANMQAQTDHSFASFASLNASDYWNEGSTEDSSDHSKGPSDLSLLHSEEGLRRFQAGQLPETDQEWHRLVPQEAQDALGKKEVQRQSAIFEIVKSEREYVADLETVVQVFVETLRNAHPPIIQEPGLSTFIREVFGNLGDILSYHKRMLAALFTRQREQHPLIQSIADIILDTTLKAGFRSAYEAYIKHYPLAESHHRKQLKQNRPYEAFIQSVSGDRRIRKRDLITFLSRPVTRLPRYNLLLQQALKSTDSEYEHPDLETLPIILGILKDLIKSTQPGIEAADSKVKFWALCESLVFPKNEIIDMDLYDESRSLIYIGLVVRRVKSEAGFTEKWTDLVAALLDNYFILAREEKVPNGTVKRVLVSRPIPLAFLRLGSFEDQPESRKEKNEEGGLFNFQSQNVPIYPFTVYHAANRMARRYTLYATSEAVRKKWHTAFVDHMGVYKVRHDSNMWFSPQVITDGFFKVPKSPEASLKVTGKINCAVPFASGSKRFIIVGCTSGVYVGPIHSEYFHLALNHRNVVSLSALTNLDSKVFNRLIVHVDSSLFAYSLNVVARVAGGQAQNEALAATVEKLTEDTNVVFCRHLHIGGRALLIYASKRRLGSTMTLHTLEAVNSLEHTIQPQRTHATAPRSFRPYGEAGYVPKDAYNIVGLSRTVGICTSGGIITADASNFAKSAITVVPDLREAGQNPLMAKLKSHLEGQRPLGFVRVDMNELLVIYDELGYYINKHGIPTRQCGFIKWETKITAYACRNGHVLLVSSEFIEVRNITTGRIVQVVEGRQIRLLYSGPYMRKDDPVLVVMQGEKNEQDGQSEKILALVETEEISVGSPTMTTTTASVWDEWDIQ